MYQQQKRYTTAMHRFTGSAVQRLQTCHGVVIKARKDWRGSGGLKLQYIAIVTFLANAYASRSRSLYAIVRPFVCRLSSNVRAPYSGD